MFGRIQLRVVGGYWHIASVKGSFCLEPAEVAQRRFKSCDFSHLPHETGAGGGLAGSDDTGDHANGSSPDVPELPNVFN